MSKEIAVCIGSCCHLKGSYSIIELYQKLLKSDKLDKEIVLKRVFCMGKCKNGISVRFGTGEPVSVVIDNAESSYYEYIKG